MSLNVEETLNRLGEIEDELQRLNEECSFIKLKVKNNFSLYEERGEQLAKERHAVLVRQKGCNHRKGGICEYDLIKGWTGKVGPGTSGEYAVIKHQFPWGDIWITCLRCGKKWKPGIEGYEEALNFPTNNVTSSSIQFQCDVNEARKLTKET